MSSGASRTIQKLEAARCQLQTAIQLWFAGGDPISIHTLTCAAHQIFHDLHRHRGSQNLQFDLFDSPFVREGRRPDWIRAVKEHMNFFKHADRNPNGTIVFDPSLTEPFIMFSLLTLEDLGAEPTSEERAFFAWSALNNSDWRNEQGLAKFINHLPVDQIAHLRGQVAKKDFYRLYNLAIHNIQIGE